jgi:cytochrome c553
MSASSAEKRGGRYSTSLEVQRFLELSRLLLLISGYDQLGLSDLLSEAFDLELGFREYALPSVFSASSSSRSARLLAICSRCHAPSASSSNRPLPDAYRPRMDPDP